MDRKELEKRTALTMIEYYCRHRHSRSASSSTVFFLCEECQSLAHYVAERLDACTQMPVKKSCRKCGIHCYSPHYREQIRAVMRYVGPRMIFIHPLATLRHIRREW